MTTLAADDAGMMHIQATYLTIISYNAPHMIAVEVVYRGRIAGYIYCRLSAYSRYNSFYR